MDYRIDGNNLIIEDLSEFNIAHILDCGQVFRYRKEGDCYTLFAKNCKCLLRKDDNRVIINTEQRDFFEEYFDLKTDYAAIKKALSESFPELLNKAVSFGNGIRILKQDPFEMIISFIISANNNIPRIKKIIEKICCGLGEEKDGYYAFPTVSQLAKADVNFFRECGAGYRAEYLVEAAKTLADFDYEEIYRADTALARKKLLAIKGVGPKVADCILLFGFGRTDVFPVDTWSRKIYAALSLEEERSARKMAVRLEKMFGKLAGYAQQYLFYYFRENKINTVI